ncbi:MAG: hybrid sensor histidine kinase/response regulator [Anaerolineae bacterium]|nr:hybrid sensor histidine kinase/response regulator [Anaerolineae bacterium]
MKAEKEQIRVLVAEDDALGIEAIQWMLDRIGYTLVGEAATGREVVEMTKTLHPDVILMDIRLPEMDGIEAARQIQEQCPTPIVVLTAYETPELVAKASACGIGAYLIKPPHARELERAILIAMERFADMRELRALNEELKAYAHTVAHDLKAPLSIIIPSAQLLADPKEFDLTIQDIQPHAQRVVEYAYKMQGIIESLLLFAEARNMEIELKPLDMAKIVEDAIKRLEWNIHNHHAHIQYPEGWPIAIGYAPWVEGVWANYLSNAIKYGGTPPEIELGSHVEPDGMVRFWVRDHGPGMTEAIQKRLFTPFIRLPDGRVKGHGLGLSIARGIVERLGGRVSVESTPGKGSTFSFTLPGITMET